MFFKFCTVREHFGAVGWYSNDPGSIGWCTGMPRTVQKVSFSCYISIFWWFVPVFRLFCSAGPFRRGQRASKRVREGMVMCWHAQHTQKVGFFHWNSIFWWFLAEFRLLCTVGMVWGDLNESGNVGGHTGSQRDGLWQPSLQNGMISWPMGSTFEIVDLFLLFLFIFI